MIAFFEHLAPTVVAIEACAASHHWARLLRSFGHECSPSAPMRQMRGIEQRRVLVSS
jgi:transposase